MFALETQKKISYNTQVYPTHSYFGRAYITRGIDTMNESNEKKLPDSKLTAKQLEEKKEAKKLKLYTVSFVAVVALLVCIALGVGISRAVANSGVREKNTIAYTVGDHQLNSVEMSYFFIDAVNNFYSTNGSYAALYGLDVTKALDQQYVDEANGITWADNLMESAKQNAQSTYALVDAANAEGYTLSEDAQAQIDTTINNISGYATLAGAKNADAYLKAFYGKGSSVESFREYVTLNTLANQYYSSHRDSLTYTNDQLREKEAENYDQYSSFTYNQYYVAVSKFLTGGTTDEDGKTTYSDEERLAAVQAAQDAANSLTELEDPSVEAFDEAISKLSINAESETAVNSTAYANNIYTSVNSNLRDWLSDSSRKEGDMTVIKAATTSTDDDGNETETVNGFYVVYYVDRNDNNINLVNVRHILVSFQGGTTENGQTTYSDAEKAAAKSSAEAILADWLAGEHTEESFAALADEKTDDSGSKGNGGLYEDVYPGQMVTAFNDWCFDDSRQVGDTGIVESDYGYHVMYFVGQADETYRDYMIERDLRSSDMETWYTALVDAVTVADGDTSRIRTNLILRSST